MNYYVCFVFYIFLTSFCIFLYLFVSFLFQFQNNVNRIKSEYEESEHDTIYHTSVNNRHTKATHCIFTVTNNGGEIFSEKVLSFVSKILANFAIDWGQFLKKGFCTSTLLIPDLKSNNLQYNTLGHWVDGTIVSSTKRLVFQVFFFFIISCKILFKNPFN